MDAPGGAKPCAGTEEDDRGNAKDDVPPVDQKAAHRERYARRQRKGNVQCRQETDELRQDEDEQAEDDSNAGDDDDQRVAGRTLDLALELRLTLEEGSHLEQAVAQVARRLARSDHGRVERTEHSRIAIHGCRQRQAGLDLLLEIIRDHAQFLVAYLFALDVQDLCDGQARVEHRAQLRGEDGHVLGSDCSTSRQPALLYLAGRACVAHGEVAAGTPGSADIHQDKALAANGLSRLMSVRRTDGATLGAA